LKIPSRFSILNKLNKFHPLHPIRIPKMALTKADFIESVHQQLGFPKKMSTELVDQLIETIKSTLASGEDVLISGFGKFCVNEKNERKGRNPATGDSMMLRPRRVITFKCSGKLRRKINES
jgi:integration host factor subunit alpha